MIRDKRSGVASPSKLDMTENQVWAGNEDDCREVTWEECNPLEKTVPMSVAKMICVDMPVRL